MERRTLGPGRCAPFLQFHYAILEPHGPLLRDRDPQRIWNERLSAVFDSRVRGPVFEEMARTWMRRHAAGETLGGTTGHVGPSTVTLEGTQHELDLVVVSADERGVPPAERAVLGLGEAKAGETVGLTRLRHLEKARAGLGTRAAHARFFLFATGFTKELRTAAAHRQDTELVDLDRLYHGE